LIQCSKCHTEAVSGAAYCHRCGARLDAAPDAADAWDRPAGTADETNGREAAPQPGASGAVQPAVPEHELWRGTYSVQAMYGTWILCGLATVGLLWIGSMLTSSFFWKVLLGAIGLLWLWSLWVFARRRLGVRYRLTSQRFFHETGLLRHVIDRIEVIDMADVACEQRLVERLFGVGTIRIISSDRSHPLLVLRGIENVQRVAAIIDGMRHAERQRRAVRVEQI
jgi:hypothetical protein